MMTEEQEAAHVRKIIRMVIAAALLVGTGLAAGCPMYGVYRMRKAGEAELARADYNRRIAVVEAQAKKDGAVALAEAEVARAEGVAKANRIIGQSLHENQDYLRWLWIEGMQHTSNQIIYIPTEGALPILEAGRRPPITDPK